MINDQNKLNNYLLWAITTKKKKLGYKKPILGITKSQNKLH